MMTRRSWAVYGMLVAIWATLIVWQTAEHLRARRAFQNMVVDRGRSISTTCGLLMRARSFFGVVSRERLEAALNELVNTHELRSVQLLNSDGEAVASAGDPFDLPHRDEFQGGVLWSNNIVIVENPVDLGTNMPQLILPRQTREELRSLETNRSPAAVANPAAATTNTSRSRFDWRGQGRPYWMSAEEYKSLIEKKGAHTFVIVMSTALARHATYYDLWMRSIIALLGTIAVAGYGLVWRAQERTSELQLRLVRASELNLHLKELNLAAAGLAHETRNPLNIIRGLAQMISKQQSASPETQAKSREIINETDRVTAQLNEFINYSRPREVRRAATDLSAMAAEVVRTLNFDVEEKKIQLELQIEPLVIEADEQLLRQALFNLLLNAVQAVPDGGAIRVRASRRNNEEAFIEISDNGPGVPPENRAEIFKPYFTTNVEGTGLGLAVVQQIILAHGWEIQCLANEPAGALFRIAHIKLKHKD
jgi:signal transduction histidine kinase